MWVLYKIKNAYSKKKKLKGTNYPLRLTLKLQVI